MFRSTCVTILAAAFTTIGLAPACGATEVKYDTVGQVRVPLKDLDLHDPGAARALLGRLDRAAWEACGGNPKFHDAYARRPEYTLKVFQECRSAAVERAVSQIGAPALKQAYAESKSAARSLVAVSPASRDVSRD